MRGIVIAGPTAVGKTELSLKIAKLFEGEIISADSAQVYKGMNIGTAKIKEEEKQGIKHFMIDIVEPNNKYSVGDYQKKVDEILVLKEKENKNIVLTGGTGLYIKAVTDGLSKLPSADLELRKKLSVYNKEKLFEELLFLDPESAKLIHENNRKRLERALEVCILTGKKFSDISKNNNKNNNYNFLKIYITRSRETLYDRINKRVDLMFEEGLLEEVKKLCRVYGCEAIKNINIIGYNEVIKYLENEISFEEAKKLIKRNSRRYAKRQITWFKKDKSFISFNLEEISEKEIISKIQKQYLSMRNE